ncbi:hypothetical protein [Micromonospora sp. NPDC051006]|uniref:hypothetical protein n=1 Tax=Micromonospora sp. NPDC051006 TaxID=3364283 RepID=UPI0037B2D33D
MEPSTCKKVGYVAGALALLLLASLAGYAVGTARPMTAELMVIGVVDLFLGMSAIKLIGDAVTIESMEKRVEERATRYVQGVGDTVDRLASVLPQKDNVRRIG